MRSVLGNGGAENPRYVRSYAAALMQQGELGRSPTVVRSTQVAGSRRANNRHDRGRTAVSFARTTPDCSRCCRRRPKIKPIGNGRLSWPKFSAASWSQREQAEAAEPLLALAEESISRIAEAEPEQQDILTAFQARQGQIEQAVERLSDPEIDPRYTGWNLPDGLANGKLSDTQVQQLIALASEAFQRHPTNEALGLCVADLHGWLGNWKEATDAYQAVLAARPDSVSALNNMAMILAMSGQQLDQASRAVNQAIANLGATDFLHDTRGMVRLASGRPKLAEQDFRAVDRNGSSADRYLHLAQALYAQQNIDEARDGSPRKHKKEEFPSRHCIP